MKAKNWDGILYTQLQQIVEHHQPTTFIYDGIALYPGLLRALKTFRFKRTTMILRLRYTGSQLEEFAQGFRLFDQIIHPDEAGEPEAGGPSPIAGLQPHRVAPIL